jgi:non-specific protein-tyrosine kinase
MSIVGASTNVALSALDRPEEVEDDTLQAPLAGIPISPDIYRQIYVSLVLPVDIGPVIGITSAMRGEGRTTIALGLAETLAQDLDTEIAVIDTDLVRPSLAARLSMPTSRGLTRVLRGEVSIDEVIQPLSERLFVVTSDAAEDESARLLRRLSEDDPFRSLRARGAVTILDLPPILEHSYSSLVASVADAVILVIRAGVTPANTARDAIDRLGDAALQGAVLNGEPAERPSRWRWR